MREILFRGKTDKNDTWVYGSLNNTDHQFPEIMYCDKNWNVCSNSIKPETIGQFTGLTDKNGTKIFEGDIVKCGNSVYVIDFGFHYSVPSDPYDYGRAYGFYFLNENKDEYYSIDDENDSGVEVIGNIYDNKELLEEMNNE